MYAANFPRDEKNTEQYQAMRITKSAEASEMMQGLNVVQSVTKKGPA